MRYPLYLFDGNGRTKDSYNYLWYVDVNGEKKLATIVSEDADACDWPDRVYLGEFDGEVKESVRADKVPTQD